MVDGPTKGGKPGLGTTGALSAAVMSKVIRTIQLGNASHLVKLLRILSIPKTTFHSWAFKYPTELLVVGRFGVLKGPAYNNL